MGRLNAIPLLAALLLAAASAGCSSGGCTDNRSSIPLAGFYSYETREAITVHSLSVGGIGAPNDSMIIIRGAADKVYLPFRAAHNSSRFLFTVTEPVDENTLFELEDTVSFTYTAIPYFVSEDCGAMYRYRITSASVSPRNFIDSIGIADSLITNTDAVRIRIFFRTASPDLQPEP